MKTLKQFITLCLASILVTFVFVDILYSSEVPRPSIGILVPDSAVLPTESATAVECARNYCGSGARMLVVQPQRALEIGDLQILWIHQGDDQPLAWSVQTLRQLRQFVRSGGKLYLSGSSLELLHRLRIEPICPRLGQSGTDTHPAAVVPTVTEHPIFAGLTYGTKSGDRKDAIYLVDGGYPAFSDFYGTDGPAAGALLAKSASGAENPICEYAFGKGRIITVGWRLAHYDSKSNVYRENLIRLTENIFDYLANSTLWQPIVPRRPEIKFEASDVGVSAHELESLQLAIEDLAQAGEVTYPRGKEFLERLFEIKRRVESAEKSSIDEATELDDSFMDISADFATLKREALLADPLLQQFDRILAIRRSAKRLGMPANWESNSSLSHTGYNNDLVALKPGSDEVQTVFRPENDYYIGELDLNYDGNRLMFSMPGENGRWQLHELDLSTGKRTEIETITSSDVDNYDGCWLPDGGICFTSTAPMIGVPCVRGSSHVTNLYVKTPAGAIRQLTVDQEHNWNPCVMANGRIMYLRWEYTDIPHAFYRLLFSVNPDGTNQVEYYGSNSWWPNSMFNARPTPNNPNRFYAVVVGHHDTPRAGELILFDASKSNFEADGVIQRIPERGKKVEPIVRDGLTRNSWPKFLHPYPLSDKRVLVACKPNPAANWGIYLVDTFDNMLLLYEEPGFAMLEPTPVMKTPVPPAIADRTDPESKTATVFLADVYAGPGLKEIRRGEVKQLRIFTYNFAYHGMGGQVDRVGLDGPWDIRMVLGTVPVEPDGSAHFTVPAYTPIAVQPLDENGAALQLMRSWFTAMPGEVVSCVGCHERTNMAPVRSRTMATNRPASEIRPFYGPTRGFDFRREVQPVLDKYCVGCHNNSCQFDLSTVGVTGISPTVIPTGFSLENTEDEPVQAKDAYYNNSSRFSRSYMNLKRFVRNATIESDVNLLSTREFHANTTRLMQTLRNDPNGHYGVAPLLSSEDWERLTTWIDMNTPAHGTWVEISGARRTDNQAKRRFELKALYAGIEQSQEDVFNAYEPGAIKPILPPREAVERGLRARAELQEATDVQVDEPQPEERQMSIPFGDGHMLKLVYIPKGKLHGKAVGGFWLGACEVTNAQYRAFDSTHDSRLETGDFLSFSLEDRGFETNADDQPAIRVSQERAKEFCEWLSEKTGRNFALPTSEQWEYSARAGKTDSGLSYGDMDTDFSQFANLSDKTNYEIPTYAPWSLPSGAIPPWRPSDPRYNDGFRVTAPVGRFAPNAWGVYDLHGNAAEWTATEQGGQAVVKGGSWNSRPSEAQFGAWQVYPTNQRVFDVGFRIILNP